MRARRLSAPPKCAMPCATTPHLHRVGTRVQGAGRDTHSNLPGPTCQQPARTAAPDRRTPAAAAPAHCPVLRLRPGARPRAGRPAVSGRCPAAARRRGLGAAGRCGAARDRAALLHRRCLAVAAADGAQHPPAGGPQHRLRRRHPGARAAAEGAARLAARGVPRHRPMVCHRLGDAAGRCRLVPARGGRSAPPARHRGGAGGLGDAGLHQSLRPCRPDRAFHAAGRAGPLPSPGGAARRSACGPRPSRPPC